MQTFTLTIKLGNDAMRSPGDVADALRHLAHVIANGGDWEPSESGGIRDVNGNRVGEWAIS